METGSHCPYINEHWVAIDTEFLQTRSRLCAERAPRKTMPKEMIEKLQQIWNSMQNHV